MRLLILLFILQFNPVCAEPLQGNVSSTNVQFCPLTAKVDKRGKLLKGHLKQTHLRGFIGIKYSIPTGELIYIYPESDLNHFGIHTGDYIVKIEKELYRPCLMTNVVIYPTGYILNLTIRTKAGVIRVVPVKLLDAKRFSSGT